MSQDEDVSIIALFDHEEVGSTSSVGAGSSLMRDAMERIHHAFDIPGSEAGTNTLTSLDYSELFKNGLARYVLLPLKVYTTV